MSNYIVIALLLRHGQYRANVPTRPADMRSAELIAFSIFDWSCDQCLRWRHNELDGVSDHQPHDCLLSLLFRRRSKKTSKLRVTGLQCAGNSPWTGEFPAQKASNAENVSISWRHHVFLVQARSMDNTWDNAYFINIYKYIYESVNNQTQFIPYRAKPCVPFYKERLLALNSRHG